MILPVYNVAPYIRAACESVLMQSWTDLELIAIDDGSTDGTAREIERIGDPRVVLIGSQHRGVAAARNTGMARARGSLIAFIDGDDLWLPGKLEQDVERLEAMPDAVLVFSSVRMVDESLRDTGRTIRRWSGVLTLRDLLIENMIASNTVLMRREACERVGCFDADLPAASDYDYWLRVALDGSGKLHGLPRVSALYRRRPGQLTGDWRQQQEAWKRIMAKIRQRCPVELAAVERESWAGFHRALAASAYEDGELGPAARLFRESFRRAPAFLLRDSRTWLLGSAILSACVLPGGLHRRLEGLVRTARLSRP